MRVPVILFTSLLQFITATTIPCSNSAFSPSPSAVSSSMLIINSSKSEHLKTFDEKAEYFGSGSSSLDLAIIMETATPLLFLSSGYESSDVTVTKTTPIPLPTTVNASVIMMTSSPALSPLVTSSISLLVMTSLSSYTTIISHLIPTSSPSESAIILFSFFLPTSIECTDWKNSVNTSRFTTLLSQQITNDCNCGLHINHFTETQLTCYDLTSNSKLSLQLKLTNSDLQNLLDSIYTWWQGNTDYKITLNEFEIRIDSACISIGNLVNATPECFLNESASSIPTSQNSERKTAIIVSMVVIVLIIVTLVILLVTFFAVFLYRRRTIEYHFSNCDSTGVVLGNNRIEMDCNNIRGRSYFKNSVIPSYHTILETDEV